MENKNVKDIKNSINVNVRIDNDKIIIDVKSILDKNKIIDAGYIYWRL